MASGHTSLYGLQGLGEGAGEQAGGNFGLDWTVSKWVYKNRSIFNNIMTTMEVVSFLNKKKRPGIIVTIDFEKCFDRVVYQSIAGH